MGPPCPCRRATAPAKVAVFKIRLGQFVCEVYTFFSACLSGEMPVGANPIMIQYLDISITNLSLP